MSPFFGAQILMSDPGFQLDVTMFSKIPCVMFIDNGKNLDPLCPCGEQAIWACLVLRGWLEGNESTPVAFLGGLTCFTGSQIVQWVIGSPRSLLVFNSAINACASCSLPGKARAEFSGTRFPTLVSPLLTEWSICVPHFPCDNGQPKRLSLLFYQGHCNCPERIDV